LDGNLHLTRAVILFDLHVKLLLHVFFPENLHGWLTGTHSEFIVYSDIRVENGPTSTSSDTATDRKL
jgi:hypothetical protein